ncbi:MAG: SIMPL domain-containing protein [Chloroflexota bacterium]|nr:SIMPL domain-containing protein [Chloroflexota bacterium]
MTRTIAVTGTGRASTIPDVADVRLGVVVTRPTVAEARGAAAETSARVLQALAAIGINRTDVRTASLIVQPEYDYQDGVQQLRGQSVTHQYLVTVSDLERLGTVVDDGLLAGATSLDGVAFRTADPAPAHAAARVAAYRDARSRAKALAVEAGVRLGKVLEIAEVEPASGPRPFGAGKLGMIAAEAVPTPIEAGEGEVVLSVAVVFAIR